MIWCVEDDASIRDIELYALRAAGLEAEGFPDGDSFWQALQSRKPELVVLDVMLPGIDGTELLRRMRATPALRRIPVIMATARGAEYDRVQGLDSGADDYLTKPFSVIELVSRVRAVLRRCQPQESTGTLRCGELTLDTAEHTVSVAGQRVDLTYKEYELLRLFMTHPGRAFTRDKLMELVWGTDYCGESRTVVCTSAPCGRSWATRARISRPSAVWATAGRTTHDKKDIPLHRGGGACGAGSQSGHHHGRAVQLLRQAAGAAAEGRAFHRGGSHGRGRRHVLSHPSGLR